MQTVTSKILAHLLMVTRNYVKGSQQINTKQNFVKCSKKISIVTTETDVFICM
jgi:hypothetical protein